jgi:hypothetical protein
VGGESLEDYHRLYDGVLQAIVPIDIVDQVWARNLTDLTWEDLRLRRLKCRLFEASRPIAVENALEPMFAEGDDATRLAADAAKGGKAARSRVESLLKLAGHDDESIRALGLAAWIDDFVHIDRMLAQNEQRRMMILHEIDRRRDAKAARQMRQALAKVEEAETVEEQAA